MNTGIPNNSTQEQLERDARALLDYANGTGPWPFSDSETMGLAKKISDSSDDFNPIASLHDIIDVSIGDKKEQEELKVTLAGLTDYQCFRVIQLLDESVDGGDFLYAIPFQEVKRLIGIIVSGI